MENQEKSSEDPKVKTITKKWDKKEISEFKIGMSEHFNIEDDWHNYIDILTVRPIIHLLKFELYLSSKHGYNSEESSIADFVHKEFGKEAYIFYKKVT